MINYERRGSGEPLVLVHGIGSRWQVWEPVFDQLAEHRDVIALDLPGFGRSEPLATTTIETLSDAVAHFCRDLGLERPHIAGNSMGGAIALNLGKRGLAPSVTAFSPAGFGNRIERAWARETITAAHAVCTLAQPVVNKLLSHPAGRITALTALFGQPHKLTEQEALGHVQGMAEAQGFDEALDDLMAFDVATGGALERIPVTIAWGTRDILLPYYTQSRRARRLLPSARHIPLPGCGHVPFSDDPRRCVDILLNQHAEK